MTDPGQIEGIFAWLAQNPPQIRQRLAKHLDQRERNEFQYHWQLWARQAQLPPPGDWRIWMIMAGRGFGKTRAGAEWVRMIAESHPEARIALVSSSLADARAVMVEGESGILACCPPERAPIFEPSLKRLRFPNGAQAYLYSAAEPEGLRGPQHSHGWCDEIGKWPLANDRATKCWDNLLLGLRLGRGQQLLATTTPRCVPLLRRIIAQAGDAEAQDREGLIKAPQNHADQHGSDIAPIGRKAIGGHTIITRGATHENAGNLPPGFLEMVEHEFGSSQLARQELAGEMVDDVEGALWTRQLIEQNREVKLDCNLARIIVAVDPPASADGDACGIVVAGLGGDGVARILADCSVERASPDGWARAVAQAATQWGADRVIAEANQGGAMVESVLRAADHNLPIRLVHARKGKGARAEPVAALYEAGRVRHLGIFPMLEDQLCGLMPGGSYRGPGRSPDRADALVWALGQLMLGRQRRPQIIQI